MGAACAVILALGGVGFAQYLSGDGGPGALVGLPVRPAPAATGLQLAPTGGAAPAGTAGSTTPGAGPAGGTVSPSSAAGSTSTGVPANSMAASATPSNSTGGVPLGSPSATSPSPTAPTSAADPTATLSAPPTTAAAGAIAGAGGLCLDLADGATADGTRVEVADCNSTDTQVWTLATDGTVQVAGKCVQAEQGGPVEIATCGGAAAQWRASPAGSLVNMATNECLTDPANGTEPDKPVDVTTCTGSANEQWTLP